MTTLKARYITLETLEKHLYCFDREAFDAEMADYGKTTRNNYELSVIEIIEEEEEEMRGEVVDTAQPILITHNGERYYRVMLSEMESTLELGGEWFSTIFDDIELSNYPAIHRRATTKK